MAGISISYPNDYVYFIVDRYTKWAMVMKKEVRDLTIYEIEGIDTKGYYFSTEEKAREAMNRDK